MIHTLLEFDGQILLFFQEFIRNRFLTPILVFITSLGNAGIIWILISIGFLFFNKTRKIGCMGLLALFFSLIVNNVLLKNLVARVRPYDAIPELIPLVKKPIDYSFPSGHTAAAFSAACVFVRNLPKKFGIPLIVLAAVIAVSRLYVGVHYPSDVLIGLINGIVLSYAAEFCVNKCWDRWAKAKAGAEAG